MSKNNATGFWGWIEQLTSWFRNQFQPGQRGPRILEEYYSDRGALFSLDCDRPGVVSFWKLVHKSATSDLLVVLISLRQLQEDLAQQRLHDSEAPAYRHWRRAFEVELSAQLENQSHVDGTHIFLVAWVSRAATKQRVDRDGRVHRFTATECSHAIICDLQGVTFAWAGENGYARKIVEVIAKRLLKLDYRQASNTWEDVIRHIDWIVWLEAYVQEAIGRTHVLQPPKYKSRRED